MTRTISDEHRKKLSESHKGQIPWNKGKATGHVPWNKGLVGIHLSRKTEFKKGMTPWNKGKKLSFEHIKNLSNSHKGIKQSKESITKRVNKTKGSNHCFWKGEKVGYDALHTWLKREFGKPYKCEQRGCIYPRHNARGVLMLSPSRYEWANITGEYLRDRDNWKMMCPSCHRKYDRINNISRKKI